jgi:phosphoribosylamine--glycine ligase
MKILVLGAGGREHALVWRLRQDPDVSDIVAAPGNPGMADLVRCVPADLGDLSGLLALARSEGADLTVVGPEAPLALGIGDLFRSNGLALLGPSQLGAALEYSKVEAKHFMARHAIPTARFEVCASADEALRSVARHTFQTPLVIKADGLAAGKGVVIAQTAGEAAEAVRAMMVDRIFGDAGARLVIEECLVGPEVSAFFLCDGRRALPLSTAQDHKRAFDEDLGPNTGGMGAFSPSPLATAALQAFTLDRIVAPVLEGMREMGEPYIGFLYVSLMLTVDGPKVIEFNARFGDPEAQVILPRIEGPFARVLYAAAEGRLGEAALTLAHDCSVGVVLAAGGYPAATETGRPIAGLENASALPATLVFHAGTRRELNSLVTSGGRVLTVVGRGGTFEEAMRVAYAGVGRIRFEGMHYRSDIGRKALDTVANASSR